MGYPEDALADDEQLLLHRHPHWKMLAVPALVAVVATTLAGFLLGLAQTRIGDPSARTAALVAVGVLWLAVLVWQCAGPLVRWMSTHFIVTDRRVLVRQGVLTHTGIDIPMGRISNVQFRHGVVDRMLRTGTLVIVSAAEDPLEFDDIPEVRRVHTLLYRQAIDGPYAHHGAPYPGDDAARDAPDGYGPDGDLARGQRRVGRASRFGRRR